MTRVLPTGWEEKTLGEVCEINIGKTPSRADVSYWDKKKETNNIWLSIADLSNTTDKKVYSSKEFLSNKGAKIVPIVERGTLLLSFKLTIGRVAFAGVPLRTNEAIAQLPIKNANTLDKNYLYYYLQAYDYEELLQGDIKVKGKSLNKAKLKQLNVKFPSLPEQKRIVEKLDKIFADIDKAKENTQKNLENAKEVFDSFLDNVFTEKSASWTQKALGDILSKEKYSMKRGPFGSALRKSFFVPQGIRVFEQYNPINNDPHWKRYFISQEKYKELEAFTAQAGDLLVSCSGSLGKIVELPQNTETGIINQALLKIKLEQTLILNSFFIYWFRSPHVQTLIREKTNGVAIPNLIAVKELKKIKVPVPSRSIQEQIVKKLNFLRAKTQELEQIYTKKLADLDELKQSVLQQAFSGKL